jgi:DNA-binding MarR family transcriptional regulator
MLRTTIVQAEPHNHSSRGPGASHRIVRLKPDLRSGLPRSVVPGIMLSTLIVTVNNYFREERMARSRAKADPPDLAAGLAFLLSQVGAHVAGRFAERLEPLEIKPPHVGILRVIGQTDGLSQQALGEKLGMFASRLVAVLDELEGRGLVERRDSPTDRRSYALFITRAGREMLEQIGQISRTLQDALCASLDDAERAILAELLARIAAEQRLTPGVHPGFRKLGD